MTISFDQIQLVNAKVNLFPYEFHISELWKHMQSDMPRGACSNYATTKYDILVLEGWPTSALRLACCYVEPFKWPDGRDATLNERYHAVLLVDFEGQTWVLDNRRAYPTEYKLLPYTWDKLQVAGTDKWEKPA
jgi:predicted transglutaminase-like cysteine proteinase